MTGSSQDIYDIYSVGQEIISMYETRMCSQKRDAGTVKK
jgi:hypothetical protein